jgi:hypothetical protein
VFSFLRHSFNVRVPAEADAKKGPIKLRSLPLESGHLGQNWSAQNGGYQKLSTAPFADFSGDRSTASWLLNAAFAVDWQQFQSTGQVGSPP